MKRIIMHWSAGAHKASDLDKKHYHFIIEGDGTVVNGYMPPEANESTKDGGYAAHTLNCNTGAIGVAVAAMAGAREAPFTAGRYPITPTQIDALTTHCARLCRAYNIPVTRSTVLSHAEVQPTLNIVQRGKWDITWLPGYKKPEAPVAVGDTLRGLIKAKMATTKPAQTRPTATTGGVKAESIAALLAVLAAAAVAFWDKITALFGG